MIDDALRPIAVHEKPRYSMSLVFYTASLDKSVRLVIAFVSVNASSYARRVHATMRQYSPVDIAIRSIVAEQQSSISCRQQSLFSCVDYGHGTSPNKKPLDRDSRSQSSGFSRLAAVDQICGTVNATMTD